jgi:hypothetical protein
VNSIGIVGRSGQNGLVSAIERMKLRPAEVGLLPGNRRRTSGLRREEVALLAGVGVT